MSCIEINVRHRGGGTMLNIYLDQKTKIELLAALESDKFESSSIPINLEISILSEWISEENPMHVKIPISEINVNTD